MPSDINTTDLLDDAAEMCKARGLAQNDETFILLAATFHAINQTLLHPLVVFNADGEDHVNEVEGLREKLGILKTEAEEREKDYTEIVRRKTGMFNTIRRIGAKADAALGLDRHNQTQDEANDAGRAAGAEGAVDLLIAHFAGKRARDAASGDEHTIRPITGHCWCTACGCIHETGTQEFIDCGEQDCHVDIYVDEGIDT